MTKRIGSLLASLVLGTTLLTSGANAAMPSGEFVSRAAIPSDLGATRSEEDERPALEGVHHRRFCLRLGAVLTRLVDAGVITREQKLRIMDAFDCVPPSTDRPTTTRPSAVRPAVTR